MADAAYFRTQAERCFRLARDADDGTAKSLIELAREYEAKAVDLERRATLGSLVDAVGR